MEKAGDALLASLFVDEEGEGYSLIWSRSRKANGD